MCLFFLAARGGAAGHRVDVGFGCWFGAGFCWSAPLVVVAGRGLLEAWAFEFSSLRAALT
jgi:hypothetical protein